MKTKLITFYLSLFMFFINSIKANPMNVNTKETLDIFQPIKQKIKRYTLPNGLKVILMQNGSTPTVALYWKILAGSSDEVKENAGIAHMLEHMLFKGTKIVGTIDFEKEKKYLEIIDRWYHKLDDLAQKLEETNEENQKQILQKKIERLKKRISIIENEVKKYQISEEDSIIYSIHGQRGYNAYTSNDVTNYQIELPSNKIEVWARLESDRIKNSVFREFYTERNVVAEERRMRVENNPFGYLYEKFLEAIYQNHPYGFPTIGPMENILKFKKEQAIEFYKNFYRPDNTVIAIVGNFDENYVLQIINKYFGNWEKPNYPIKRNKNQAIQYHPVNLKITKEGSPIQLLAWLKPNFPSRDDLILQILSDILAGRTDTRLHKKLIEKEKLVSQLAIYTSEPGERYNNLFLILIYPNLSILKNPKDYKELENLYIKIKKSILEELQMIINEGVDDKELKRVKETYLTNFIKKMRSNSYLADILTYYELLYGDYNIIFDYYNIIEDVSSKDIQNAIKNYLKVETIYQAELYPQN